MQLIPTEFVKLLHATSNTNESITKAIQAAMVLLPEVLNLFKSLKGIDFTKIGLCLHLGSIFKVSIPKGYVLNEETWL